MVCIIKYVFFLLIRKIIIKCWYWILFWRFLEIEKFIKIMCVCVYLVLVFWPFRRWLSIDLHLKSGCKVSKQLKSKQIKKNSQHFTTNIFLLSNSKIVRLATMFFFVLNFKRKDRGQTQRVTISFIRLYTPIPHGTSSWFIRI